MHFQEPLHLDGQIHYAPKRGPERLRHVLHVGEMRRLIDAFTERRHQREKHAGCKKSQPRESQYLSRFYAHAHRKVSAVRRIISKKAAAAVGAVIVLVALAALAGSVFVVDQELAAVVMQADQPVSEPITTPGLHFRKPFVQRVLRLKL